MLIYALVKYKVPGQSGKWFLTGNLLSKHTRIWIYTQRWLCYKSHYCFTSSCKVQFYVVFLSLPCCRSHQQHSFVKMLTICLETKKMTLLFSYVSFSLSMFLPQTPAVTLLSICFYFAGGRKRGLKHWPPSGINCLSLFSNNITLTGQGQ